MANGLALLGLGAVWRGFAAAAKKSNMAENFPGKLSGYTELYFPKNKYPEHLRSKSLGP
jgi:hypothetical protein